MANEFYRQRVGQHLEIGLKALEKLKAQEWARLHSRKLRNFAEVAFRYYFWSRLSATKSKQFYAALLDRMMTEHPDLLTSEHKVHR